MDPVSAVAGGVGALVGGIQSLIGGGQARRARRALDNLQTPTYQANRSILDYYNQALNPQSSLEYQLADQETGANLATGLSAAQDRRGGLAAIGGLVRQRNNAMLRTAADAQSRLGQATQMKAAEDQQEWNVNKMLPFQKKYATLMSQMGAGNQLLNSGLSNAFGGLSTFATSFTPKK